MTYWIDAQLSPKLAFYLRDKFKVNAFPVRELKLRDAKDTEIFFAARKEKDVVVVTKDRDFIELLERYGSPPKILYLTIGNIPNKELQLVFDEKFLKAVAILENDDQVEIGL